MQSYRHAFLLLCLILIFKAAIILFAIFNACIGLGPDEAQYWTWSQLLDWGYYSKPPGIAWEIWTGTHLFGNTELGVRSMPLLLGTALPLLVFMIAKYCRLSPVGCFWSGVAIALSPLGVLNTFLAITDGGMVIFWAATGAYLAEKIDRRQIPNYLIVGLLLMCGALFKWPTYIMWLFVLGSWIFYPWMPSWRVLGGIGVSLAALLPSIYWNMTHEWATFRHVSATVSGGHGQPNAGALHAGNVPEFIGSQFALVSPLLFVMLLIAFVALWKRRREVSPALLFCGGVSLVSLLAAVAASGFMKIQGNWAIFAYPTAFVVLCWYGCEVAKTGRGWLMAGVILSVILCAAIFAIPTIQSKGWVARLSIPYKISPFRHNVGWQHLAGALEQAGYDPEKDFLAGDKYQMASVLSFYTPRQRRAYFMNLQGTRKNQFSFWPGIDKEQLGKRGFFVVVENSPELERQMPGIVDEYKSKLQTYFGEVKFLGVNPLFTSYGRMVKGALIFECLDYNGTLPQDPDLY